MCLLSFETGNTVGEKCWDTEQVDMIEMKERVVQKYLIIDVDLNT